MKTKALSRIMLMIALLMWVVLMLADEAILFSEMNNLAMDIPTWVPHVLFGLFVVSLYYYYKFRIERDDTLNFTDLLWKVFASGLVATMLSLGVRFLMFLLGETRLASNILFSDLIYQINFGLMISFLAATFISWKRLILYQKSKRLIQTWTLFEFILLFFLVYDTFSITLPSTLFISLIVVLGILILMLSGNMKWVAYLNFKQKWTSILLLILTLFYLGYFFYTVSDQSDQLRLQSAYFLDFRMSMFNLLLFSFVVVYSIFSFLVILFNLPTSSVFEQKLEEVVNFQRISQSTQTEKSEDSVYNILLESSVSSVFADAAWLEIKSASQENGIYAYQITNEDVVRLKEQLKEHSINGLLDHNMDKTRNLSKRLASIKGIRFRSLITFPIVVKDEHIGTLALLKELPEGFNKEMTRIVSAFANQAGISIENFRLMEEALENERHQEELKIAKNVQKSLLPERLERNPDFEIAAFSQSADEVGGDYYDTIRIDENKVALIIADVSGKGTTAAFHMSQMKGIFHSLAQQDLSPNDFMIRANNALIFCLERGSFISAAYFVIDQKKKSIQYSRAGHCPVLYYKKALGKSEYLQDKGAALGMIRNADYVNFISNNELGYLPGDIMVLYTDGITEGKNNKGEEFSYERLQKAVDQEVQEYPSKIQEFVIKQLYEFTGTNEIDDDYTALIVKFN